MLKSGLTFLVFVVQCAFSFAQIDIKVRDVRMTTGGTNVQVEETTTGTIIFHDGVLQSINAKQITIIADYNDVWVECRKTLFDSVPLMQLKSGDYILGAPEARYAIEVWAADPTKPNLPRTFKKTFAVDIGPQPNPDPIDPGPLAPIPELGYRVLCLYESEDLMKYPSGQREIFFSQKIRAWLNENCVVGPDGRTREWRFLDVTAPHSDQNTVWWRAMQRQRGDLPWLIISDGTRGYEGPLPATLEATLTLLKEYRQ